MEGLVSAILMCVRKRDESEIKRTERVLREEDLDIQTAGRMIESETKTARPRSKGTRRGPIRNNGCLSTGRSQLPHPARSGLLRLRREKMDRNISRLDGDHLILCCFEVKVMQL